MSEPQVLTLAETAAILRVSTRTLYREVRRKRLTLAKIGGSTMVRRSELERYLRESEHRTVA